MKNLKQIDSKLEKIDKKIQDICDKHCKLDNKMQALKDKYYEVEKEKIVYLEGNIDLDKPFIKLSKREYDHYDIFILIKLIELSNIKEGQYKCLVYRLHSNDGDLSFNITKDTISIFDLTNKDNDGLKFNQITDEEFERYFQKGINLDINYEN